MAFIHSLCSSSKGNSTYIGDQSAGILIDAGIGIRAFTSCLQAHDIEPDAIKAIFITHEHTDHIKGLPAVLKRVSAPIYGSRETLEQLIDKGMVGCGADLNEINRHVVCAAGMEIAAFSTPHDSANSTGYHIIMPDGKQVAVCTDLGDVTDEVYNGLRGCECVLLESNYDEGMLTYGDYPYFLKQRISSGNGHLSNDVCSKTLVRLLNDGTKSFLLGHLSENNNRPELALQSALCELSLAGARLGTDYSLMIAPIKSAGQLVMV